MRRVINESLNMYRELESLGYDVGLVKSGSINLAQTQERAISLQRRISYSKVEGLECEFITPKQIQEIHPYIFIDDLIGGVYVPDDAYADPSKVCDALIDIAKKNGVQYRDQCQVNYILTDANTNSVVGVETDIGVVECEYFVNAAGMWSRELGFKCRNPVKIPAYPGEHYYLITNGLNIPQNLVLPCVRDYDSSNYSRQDADEFLIGWFEDEGQEVYDGNEQKDWMNEIPENLRLHLERIWFKLIERYPALNASQGSPFMRNSPDTFTPDGRWILGESPDVNRYYVATGTNGNSLQGAGGLGKFVAEWIIEGSPTHELFSFSLQRFLEVHNNRSYLEQRVKEIVNKHYQIAYPNQSEYKYARKLRTSPLYSVLEQRGGVFGTKMAYERALYFDTTYKRGDPLPIMPSPTSFKPKFFNFLENEYAACRETVGIIDISSFSKIKIKSSNTKDVVDYLQRLCTNNADIGNETCIKTGMLNKNGGYENECIIVRQTPNTFFMISPSSQQTRTLQWMQDNLPVNNTSIRLSDHTSSYTVLNVVGPKAFMLMSELTNSNIKLKPFHYKKCNIGFASDVLVLSYTHTGETGYCLYIPSEYAIHVYDELMKVGLDYGAKDVGTLTQRFMRTERFIPFTNEELISSVTPLEAGQEHYVDFSKDFLGKEVLMKQKQNGIKKRLVMFIIDDLNVDEDLWPWGSEPIFRNSEYVGHVTSANYGFTCEKMICLGFIQMPEQLKNQYITMDFIKDPNAVYEIDIAGTKFKASVFTSPSELSFLKQQDENRDKSAVYRPMSTVFSVKKRQ